MSRHARCAPTSPTQIQREKTARKAAAATHVTFAATRKLTCPYDPCPLVVDRYPGDP